MEKLIELLNEYQGQDSRSYDEKQGTPYIGWGDDLDYECYIISKKYGFIKWLVENDKIDRHKFYDKNILKGFVTLTKEEKADSIIMNLSISDTPIDFLCEILK